MQNASPGKKLTDSVMGLTEATRWGRLGTAANYVDPGFRNQFIENHRHWGGVVQVANSEVVHIEVSPDQEQAIALISYEWFLAGNMALSTTVVRQRWVQINGSYGLMSETVVQGDQRLFNPHGDTATAETQAPVSLLGDPTDY